MTQVIKDSGTQMKKYLVVFRTLNSLIVDVYWNVNLPNNPSFDEILTEWIYENYGSVEFEYEELEDVETVEVGAVN